MAQERADKKLRADKDKAKELTTTLAGREELFAQKGARTSTFLVESLGSAGAIVSPFVVPKGDVVERAYFRWFEA